MAYKVTSPSFFLCRSLWFLCYTLLILLCLNILYLSVCFSYFVCLFLWSCLYCCSFPILRLLCIFVSFVYVSPNFQIVYLYEPLLFLCYSLFSFCFLLLLTSTYLFICVSSKLTYFYDKKICLTQKIISKICFRCFCPRFWKRKIIFWEMASPLPLKEKCR